MVRVPRLLSSAAGPWLWEVCSPKSFAVQHTILLIQATASASTRTFSDYESVDLAMEGTRADEIRWEKVTMPVKLMSFDDGTVVSPCGWNLKASRHAIQFAGRVTAVWLNNTSNALCTGSLIKHERGRQYMGSVLSTYTNELTDYQRRSFLQA